MTAPASATTPVHVPRQTLTRVFWRCLFLQAAWNRRGMQNLGFAYAIEPALCALYADPAQREEALRRHLGFFNCHPYMAAAIVGGAIHHEERVAAGIEPGQGPLAYKQALQGPLAAIGDGFFWTALRPFFGALAALGALLLGGWAIVAALVLYNVISFALRIGLFRAGYREGDRLVQVIGRLSLPAVADRLRTAGAALAGVAAAVFALRGPAALPAGLAPEGAALAVAAAVLGYVALARGARLMPTAYLATLAAATVAFLAVLLQGAAR
ncbi:MAG: PTS system mannose/fructose/sorbose family transporter subunit IID [Anaeromyxobacter sp.]